MTEKTKTILLVDDDETILWTLTTALKRRDPDLKIYQANSGLEAYSYFIEVRN